MFHTLSLFINIRKILALFSLILIFRLTIDSSISQSIFYIANEHTSDKINVAFY